MEACTVQIMTETQGKRTEMRARGFLIRDGTSFRAVYRDGGDDVTLSYDGALTMERIGSVSLSARFAEGEETALILRLAGTCGQTRLKTSFLKLDVGCDSFLMKLCYELLFDAETVPYRLQISIDIRR